MDSKQLQKTIEYFETYMLPRMVNGDAYYRTKNTAIMSREKSFYNIAARKNVTDYTKANHKLASNFTRILVDQKLNYSINNKMVLEADGLENLIDIKKFKKDLKKISKNATNEIYGVIQWFIKDNKLKYKIIPSKQVILIMDQDDEEIIDKMIRIYEEGDIKKAEIVTDIDTTYYILADGEWKLDNAIAINPMSHVTVDTKANEQILASDVISWGRVPVSPLYNTDTMQTDLEMFKNYVDMYDICISDFGNNLEDFQELYWVLKGYEGQGAEEFMQEFKKSRILKVGEGGDASQHAQEVPFNARQTCLDILKNDIYRFGMGVDPDSISGDTTNVTIKALFSNLDLKANAFEEQIEEFLQSVLYFVNRYAEMTRKKPVESIEAKFNRATIMNKQEIIQGILQQLGFRAKSKLLAEHPDVIDVEEELEALEKEKESQMDNMGFGDE